jgi:acetyl-CoA C-acetyltransferase
MTATSDRDPVLIGVGEVVDRSRDPKAVREPLALMLAALAEAEKDSGVKVLNQIDSIDVVCEYSWPYVDAAGLLAHRLRVEPRHLRYGDAGGETPIRFFHEAALRIQRGESDVAVIVGGESAHAVAQAAKAGIRLEWSERDVKAKLAMGADLSPRIAVDHGIAAPIYVYPLYENAAVANWRQTPRQGITESSRLWADLARIARANPCSWLKPDFTAGEIAAVGGDNRLIAWPYSKYMVANPMVNQGAALLVVSRVKAMELGIDKDDLIYVWGGASANEPQDFIRRDQYACSHAQSAVLEASMEVAECDEGSAFEAVELYSCFPVVPKMARRLLKLPESAVFSVTGGLSFFGGPLNNYMTHATVAMVRALRHKKGSLGLLYGQGEFVTKHHALVLGSKPRGQSCLKQDFSVQSRADVYSGASPQLVEEYLGPASLETFTVIYGRGGKPEFGTVIARTPTGARLVARVPCSDERTIQYLTNLDGQPIGQIGQVSRLDEKRLQWGLA